MSIDLNWETLTTGPDGEALAHSIRDFIHTKFQSVPLPRFIKSVTVHDFEFGATPPELELKDITDPLPDFYEENSGADDDDDDSSEEDDEHVGPSGTAQRASRLEEESAGIHELRAATERRRGNFGPRLGPAGARLSAIPPYISTGIPSGHMRGMSIPQDLGSPFLGTSTPGIPGGTSNLNYFHSHLTGGFSGTQTPLAAVAGAQLGNNNNNNHKNHHHHHHHNAKHHQHPWRPEVDSGSPLSISTAAFPDNRAPSHSRNPSQGSVSVTDSGHHQHHGLAAANHLGGNNPALREKSSVSTFAPTTSSAGTSRPPTRDNHTTNSSTANHNNNNNSAATSSAAMLAGSAIAEDEGETPGDGDGDHRRFREPRTEDIQAVFRIRYSGDVKLLLTADILLDYPMPSFVGIPLRLSITGLSFDGVGVVAYIRKRVHFCFLSPEDALAAVGADDGEQQQQQKAAAAGEEDAGPSSGGRPGNGKMGGLLQEIRVESEIGQREGGKQSLKNVGKVERFVLEQVRRIFEEEFVYPSFWTFLV